MKKFALYIFMAAFVASCGNSYEEQKRITKAERALLQRQDSLALKVAVMPTLDCMPLFLAKERQLYDTAKLDLRLRYFTAQMDCDTAIAGKSVEGFVSDLVRTERLKRNGVKLDYVSSTGAYWQLLANHKARIKQVEQLGDKMVAMTRYSATDLLTDIALEGVKTSSMVFRIQVNDVNVRLAMLLNNEMDAMWLPEPQATVARRMKHTKLFDSRDKKLSLGVIAFRNDAMNDKRRKKQIEELMKAYNSACDSINQRGMKHYSDLLYKYYKAYAKTVNALPKIKFEHAAKPRQEDINVATGKNG